MTETIKDKLIFLKNPQHFSSIYYKFLILIVITVLWYLNKDIISKFETIRKIIFLTFYYFLLNIIFNYGKLAFIYVYFKKNNLQIGHKDNLTIAIDRISFFLNHLLFILLLINVLVIKITTLLTSLSIVAVALVLIFKDYVSNFINGIILMFSNDFRIKDTIKMGDNKGRIVDITFQNVQIKNDSGDMVYIPNSNFLSKEITNYSKGSLKNILIEALILRNDLNKFEKEKSKIIKKIFKEFSDNISKLEDIHIEILKLEKETITLSFEISLTKYHYTTEKSVKSFILKEIGISFPNKKEKKKEK